MSILITYSKLLNDKAIKSEPRDSLQEIITLITEIFLSAYLSRGTGEYEKIINFIYSYLR